jgi:excisionase family DNA binding protein
MPGPLLRPSQLARFWELHPRTVVQWIHDGRLPAIRTPGGQWRVRSSDLAEHCARASLPVPPFATPARPRVILVGAAAVTVRAVRRALHGSEAADIVLEAFAEPLDGLFAAVREPPALVAVDASMREVDALAAVRGLTRAIDGVCIVAFHATSSKRADVLMQAGATRALVKQREPSLAATITQILASTHGWPLEL